ncbi:MAG TPA: aminotransferase class IV, partial [Trichococcus flocculiformis]|nr:aminotransferase class IV [Trichococcus flocculiformis]
MTQTEEQKALNIDWKNLGFSYIKTDYRFISYWKDGKWDDGEMTTDNKVHISEGSPVLHYGQSCFEGMKAYRTKDGSINLFRPEENAKRMINSCQRLLMPEFPVEKFVEAAKAVVKANEKWVPPYNTGSTLYLRPYLMGVGDNIGVSPATEYIFSIFAMPVGPYFKGG